MSGGLVLALLSLGYVLVGRLLNWTPFDREEIDVWHSRGEG